MIRIISGRWRGRRLHTPPDAASARPLPDRVRTALFNMLVGHLEGQAVLDVFAGIGSFGLEAASRGAASVLMIERDREVLQILRHNIDTLGAEPQVDVAAVDALGPAALARAPRPIHLAFFDPPYAMMEDPPARRRVLAQLARAVELLDADGYAILRTPNPLVDTDERDAGQSDAGKPSGPRQLVDLSLPGAVGPETHPYGSTALHWYIRDVSGERPSEA